MPGTRAEEMGPQVTCNRDRMDRDRVGRAGARAQVRGILP